MSLLARVSEVLKARGIPHVLVGASALTIHGVNRSTIDLDLFTIDRACLDPRMWDGLAAEGVGVEVRKGDPDDPLAGVVRLKAAPELPLDVVVGKHRWQQRAIERAEMATFIDVEVPVLGGVDLILLKLFAGGPQDAWDIQQLLTGPERDSLIAGVERDLPDLPADASRDRSWSSAPDLYSSLLHFPYTIARSGEIYRRIACRLPRGYRSWPRFLCSARSTIRNPTENRWRRATSTAM